MTDLLAVPEKLASPQAVGAFGEKAVEAELLRHGWLTSNVNSSVKNAEDFDIFAKKGKLFVGIRVKTSKLRIFQFNFAKRAIVPQDIEANDFTVLVSMATTRGDDEFYVIATKELRLQIEKHRECYLHENKRDGKSRKDVGMWTLHLDFLAVDPNRYSHGYKCKWKNNRDAWYLLDGCGPLAPVGWDALGVPPVS